ncbi:MAG TPA: hypothetical protein P5048_00070 [Chlamydiales bacterium]|nr:hypothetical protein [Chlamydiales bacterium]
MGEQQVYSHSFWNSLELQSVGKDKPTPKPASHQYQNYAYAFMMLTMKNMNDQENNMKNILLLESIRSNVQAIIDKIQDLMGKLTDMKFTFTYTNKNGDKESIVIDPSKFSKDDWKDGNPLDNPQVIAKYINAQAKTEGEKIDGSPTLDWDATIKNNASLGNRGDLLHALKTAYQSLTKKGGLLEKLKDALAKSGEKDPENTPIYKSIEALIGGFEKNIGPDLQKYLDDKQYSKTDADKAFADLAKTIKESWAHTHAPSDDQSKYATDGIANQRDLDSTAIQMSTSLSNTDSTNTSYMMQKYTQFDKVGQDGLRSESDHEKNVIQNMARG